MDLGLQGKKALVTGASAGLGAAAAEALAREGAEVVINGRDKTRIEEAANGINERIGVRPGTVVGDVSIKEEVNRICESIGDIDILVSNAGGPPPGQLTEHDDHLWDDSYKLVLASAINLTRNVIDGMIKRQWGRLIYITSVGVLQPIDELILSNTFRVGVAGFCKTVSNNYAKYGITANCVCPGYTATERLTSLAQNLGEKVGKSTGEVMNGFAANTPAGRIGHPDELAALITFLASDKAAYITGTAIPVDGGLVRALI